MKVLTILQPYATLIALGEKSIETRGWKPDDSYLGPLLIHAGKGKGMIREVHREPTKTILARHGITRIEHLEFGLAIAVTNLKSFARSEVLQQSISRQELMLGNYKPGRWGWQLEGTRRLDRCPELRGQQGIWDWEPPPGFELKFHNPAPVTLPELCGLAGVKVPAAPRGRMHQ